MSERMPAVSDDTDAFVAEVIAIMLQLPVFLVCRRDDHARIQWFDAAYAAIAESWRDVCNLPRNRTLHFMTAVSGAVTVALQAVEQALPSPDLPAQRRQYCLVWRSADDVKRRRISDIRSDVVLGWLQHVSPAEIDALARAWQMHRDGPSLHALSPMPADADDQAAARVWILKDHYPALANLDTRLAMLTPAAFGPLDAPR